MSHSRLNLTFKTKLVKNEVKKIHNQFLQELTEVKCVWYTVTHLKTFSKLRDQGFTI